MAPCPTPPRPPEIGSPGSKRRVSVQDGDKFHYFNLFLPAVGPAGDCLLTLCSPSLEKRQQDGLGVHRTLCEMGLSLGPSLACILSGGPRESIGVQKLSPGISKRSGHSLSLRGWSPWKRDRGRLGNSRGPSSRGPDRPLTWGFCTCKWVQAWGPPSKSRDSA